MTFQAIHYFSSCIDIFGYFNYTTYVVKLTTYLFYVGCKCFIFVHSAIETGASKHSSLSLKSTPLGLYYCQHSFFSGRGGYKAVGELHGSSIEAQQPRKKNEKKLGASLFHRVRMSSSVEILRNMLKQKHIIFFFSRLFPTIYVYTSYTKSIICTVEQFQFSYIC